MPKFPDPSLALNHAAAATAHNAIHKQSMPSPTVAVADSARQCGCSSSTRWQFAPKTALLIRSAALGLCHHCHSEQSRSQHGLTVTIGLRTSLCIDVLWKPPARSASLAAAMTSTPNADPLNHCIVERVRQPRQQQPADALLWRR